MKIAKLEAIPVRIPYKRVETSSLIARGGVADVLVKVTTEDGLVGWGECTRAADVPGIESAVNAMAPVVIGRSAWDKEAIHRELAVHAVWAFQPMTANFAYGGIDMALWDVCGKACGEPLYRLLGGALREEVDYFYYMEWGGPEEISGQAADGVRRGYSVYYIKAGVDEAPVRIDPVENMRDLQSRIAVPLCVNEGLWREADAYRVIKSRCGDYLCYSSYWVGSLLRFHALNWMAHLEGWLVCKHTHGELGLTAAAGQHAMLAAPNACLGHQQTAQMMADDILTERIPIADGPRWGRIDKPGLGVAVDEDKVARYHAEYRKHGEFPTYVGKAQVADGGR